MSGFWLVLAKAEILLFALGEAIFLIIGIVSLIRRESETESGEDSESTVTEMTEHGIVTECRASNRCAAVSGILEAEREREQLRKEYNELLERYKNLQSAYDCIDEAFKNLEEEHQELKKANIELR